MGPRKIYRVVLSSSFEDLEQHRALILAALKTNDLHAINMEDRPQRPSRTVVDSSLDMVDEAEGFVGFVSHRYGAIHTDPKNPDELSLTELEYRRALERGIPMTMFVMSEDHAVAPRHVEFDAAKRAKLERWKRDVAQRSTYTEFDSLEDLRSPAERDVAALRRELDLGDQTAAPPPPPEPDSSELDHPVPPEPWALPPYTPGHEFVGRRRELQLLDDWLCDPDSTVLLFDAIGGMGKSMLTWEWMRQRARQARPDLAGVFWYSFYERGADMDDFVRLALAYTTGRHTESIQGSRSSLNFELLRTLQRAPWLIVLDGLERILVAYHRIDKAQVSDARIEEEATASGTPAGSAGPLRHCIRDADTVLLRHLTSCAPSKILATSRLTPLSLLNAAGIPRPAVQIESLLGLDSSDAEAILTNAGIAGRSSRIRSYLQKHFACHPLVVGIVAGLVRNYRKAPCQFEPWADDPEGGAEPKLASWNLAQKKSHILTVAFSELGETARAILGRLALIDSGFDEDTLLALATHPLGARSPQTLSTQEAEQIRDDLEQRGLLNWNRSTNTYDLHPVVRGFALESLDLASRKDAGELVADHFSRRPESATDSATRLDDLFNELQTHTALAHAENYDRAWQVFSRRLLRPLVDRLYYPHKIVELLRPLIAVSDESEPRISEVDNRSIAMDTLASALMNLGRGEDSVAIYERATELDLNTANAPYVQVGIGNLATALASACAPPRIASAAAMIGARLRISRHPKQQGAYLRAALVRSTWINTLRGEFDDADSAWLELEQYIEASSWGSSVSVYEAAVRSRSLMERDDLDGALHWVRTGMTRADEDQPRPRDRVDLIAQRAEVGLRSGDFARAAKDLEAVSEFRRERGLPSAWVRARLAYGLARSGSPAEAARVLEEIDFESAPLQSAEALFELDRIDEARPVLELAWRTAWADGPPYSIYDGLRRARALYARLGESPPELPSIPPSEIGNYPLKDRVEQFIESLGPDEALDRRGI